MSVPVATTPAAAANATGRIDLLASLVQGVKLRASQEIASGTTAFHFDKPAGFIFEPGQAVDLVLPAAPDADAEALRHTFSLVSAPCEEELVIATRMRNSVYKRALAAMPAGGRAIVEGPFGSLTLDGDRSRGAVLVAGGIGITPFISILRQAAHERSAQRLALVYSNRRPEDAAFLAELQQLERDLRSFRLLATMTDMARSTVPWSGETRLVDVALVTGAADGLSRPIYYVVGPPGMVEAVSNVLTQAGIAADDIRSEEFYGY
jgi:ferredoxin-NADP reductase